MNSKIVSQLDDAGYFVGPTVADESPLEPDVFLLPRGCVDSLPPDLAEGQRARWQNGWVIEDAPPPVEPPAPTEAQVIEAHVAAVQKRLDDFARTRGYDSMLSACAYVASNVPKFASEAAYAVAARDATWVACYEILAAVQTGQRAAPTVEELAAELPALSWPA